MVVIQKEPRSRRVEDDSDQSAIGAGGLNVPVTFDDLGVEEMRARQRGSDGGESVPVDEIAAVDAFREPPYASDPLTELDHVDDDDDDDVEIEGGETGQDEALETPMF